MIDCMLKIYCIIQYNSYTYYCGEIAETGQMFAHAPQSMQVSGLMSYLLDPSEIAVTGHSAAHAPQQTQSSLIK